MSKGDELCVGATYQVALLFSEDHADISDL